MSTNDKPGAKRGVTLGGAVWRVGAAFAGAVLAAPAAALEIAAPPAGAEFTLSCVAAGGRPAEARFRVTRNEGGIVRSERADDPRHYRVAPAWAWLFADIYDEVGTPGGASRMQQLSGPPGGLQSLVQGTTFAAEYRWSTPANAVNRTHTVTVAERRKILTEAFGEQEVVIVRDEVSGPLHAAERHVAYAPALRMFVAYAFRNARTNFAQDCVLVALKVP